MKLLLTILRGKTKEMQQHRKIIPQVSSLGSCSETSMHEVWSMKVTSVLINLLCHNPGLCCVLTWSQWFASLNLPKSISQQEPLETGALILDPVPNIVWWVPWPPPACLH